MSKGYRKILEFDPQCDADGCEATAVTTDGTMNWCEKHQPAPLGRPPLLRDGVPLRGTIERAQLQRIQAFARTHGMTDSEAIRALLQKALES